MNKCLLFLFGLLQCHNIFWVLKLGNTFFVYVELIVAIFLIFSAQTHTTLKTLKIIAGSWLINYFILTLFAVIPSYFIFKGTLYEETPVKGFIMVFVALLVPMAVIQHRKDIHLMLNGYIVGIFLNVLYSLLCYVLFQIGITWRISDYITFDDMKFINYLDYYRTQGFFLECSHYMAFLAASLPLLLYKVKNNLIKIAFVLIVVFLGAISFSGNLTNILLALFLYFYWVEQKLFTLKRSLYILIPLIIGVFFFSQEIRFLLDDTNFYELFEKSMTDIDLADEDNSSNVIRSKGMLDTWKLIKNNPLGVGYGCGAPLLELNFSTEYAQSTYSFALRVLLESGWLGFTFYLLASIRIAWRLYRMNLPFSRALLASIICMFVAQSANGIGWVSYTTFLLTICCLFLYSPNLFVRFMNHWENS